MPFEKITFYLSDTCSVLQVQFVSSTRKSTVTLTMQCKCLLKRKVLFLKEISPCIRNTAEEAKIILLSYTLTGDTL